jgi:hypothetical protein
VGCPKMNLVFSIYTEKERENEERPNDNAWKIHMPRRLAMLMFEHFV